MDGSHFDALSRALRHDRSRRGLTRLLGGLAVGSPLARLGLEETTAKHKKHKKKHHGAPRCARNCEQRICGSDGCGGSCGTCAVDQDCAEGRCASRCPSGEKLCGATCLPNNQCCTDADCPASSPTCCGGVCLDLQTDARHCGACGRRCTVNERCVGGACACGITPSCSTATPELSCCLNGACECASHFLDLTLCSASGGPCPAGTTLCTATTNNCADAFPAQVCCPPGTTCTTQGTCLIA